MDNKQELIKIFAQTCNIEIAKKAAALFKLYSYKKGEHIFEENKVNRHFSFVCKGVLRSYDTNADGDENNIFFITENNFFSGNFIPETKITVNIQCLTKVTCLLADFKEFHRLAFENECLYMWYARYIDRMHVKIKERITSTYFTNATERYYAFLERYPGLLNRIPHYHIASHIGVTPTQLSRIRKAVK
ncbi:MAG: Crp/Fnr family transcriptional regulator [Prolixibacteraceae bacterium]|nr:Crp/Fnr family transcriptional regulator [Prolixibacteraceae bacterium]